MTDQPGRDPAGTPSGGSDSGAPRERSLPVPRPTADIAPVDRFTAPPSTHDTSLSPERAAAIVRQSSSARWVGFLATLVVVIFVIIYYFYDLGVPGIAGTSRLVAEANAQAITSVEKGYNIYEASCARCHGQQGEGGIGPVLNDQTKLFVHLNPQYLRNVLYSGGRYVCGNATSVMPVWDQTNGGPLNYEQINDLIAFLRATNEQEYVVRDPDTKEPILNASGKEETFTGWRDPTFKPAPDATPFPACWTDAFNTPTPSGSPGASGTPGPSVSPGGTVVTIKALNIAFDPITLEAPADQAFTLSFDNADAGISHNVQILDATGASAFKGDIFPGVETRDYSVPALAAGAYTFVCDVHPNMTGTLTVK